MTEINVLARSQEIHVDMASRSVSVINAGPIGPAGPMGTLSDGSVTTAKIADGAVTNAKLGASSVTSSKIADGTIATADIADGAITSAKIANGTIVEADLADGAVTSAKIAAGAVATGDIADGAVTSAKIADGTVTSAKIADGTITANDLADGAVTSAKIADGTIVEGDLANGAVTSAKLANGAVGATQLADGSITSSKITDGTIATADLADGAVTSAKIANGTIVEADLADGAITSAKIATGAVATDDLADGVVTSAKIADGAVTSAKIADGTITTTDIADGSITAAKVAADVATQAELDAVAAVAGPRALLNLIPTNYLSAPAPAGLAGATELDLRVLEAPPSYVNSAYIAQGNSASVNVAFLAAPSTGSPHMAFGASSNGTSAPLMNVPNMRPAIGTIGMWRFTWRASDGRYQAFKKVGATVAELLDNTGWTLQTTATTGPTAPLFASTSPVMVNAYNGGGASGTQRLLAISLATAIDGAPSMLWRADGMQSPFVDQLGNLWSFTGSDWSWVDVYGNRVASGNLPAVGLVRTGPREWEGSGSPEGVLAARIGTRYIDRDATNGAIEWIKYVNVGPTGWRVVYGDTGWRKIASWTAGVQDVANQIGVIDLNEFTLNGNGVILLKRWNETIIVAMPNANANSIAKKNAGHHDLFVGDVVPWGFQVDPNGRRFYSGMVSVANVEPVLDAGVVLGRWRVGSLTPGILLGLAHWMCPAGNTSTANNWPTVLPGVAA